MLDPDGLNVWSDQRLVGYLWRNTQGQIGFRYEEDWLTQGGFAISHTLICSEPSAANAPGHCPYCKRSINHPLSTSTTRSRMKISPIWWHVVVRYTRGGLTNARDCR